MSWVGTAIAVGVGSQVVGGALQSGANSKANAVKQAALDRFTSQQKGIFDQRQDDLTGSNARIGSIQDQSFSQGLGIKNRNFNDLLTVGQRADTQGFDATKGTIDQVKGLDALRNTSVDQSLTGLNTVTSAEEARQRGFDTAGKGAVSDLIAGTGTDKFTGAFARGAGDRVGRAFGAIRTSAPAITGADPRLAAELDKQSAKYTTPAAETSVAQAAVGGTGDAVDSMSRGITHAGQKIDVLGRNAITSREALDPEIAAAQKLKDNAEANATTRKANAQQNLSDFMTSLADEKARADDRINTRDKGSMDALNNETTGMLQSEQDFVKALVANGVNYEDALRQLANYKIGGTIGTSPLGTLLSGAGGAAMGAGFTKLLV